MEENMEIKLEKEELEYIPDGSLDYVLDGEYYLCHFPELVNLQGKKLPFYVIKLKGGVIWFVANFKREKPKINPKLIKRYSGKTRNVNNCKGITIKCNTMYHLVADVFIFI